MLYVKELFTVFVLFYNLEIFKTQISSEYIFKGFGKKSVQADIYVINKCVFIEVFGEWADFTCVVILLSNIYIYLKQAIFCINSAINSTLGTTYRFFRLASVRTWTCRWAPESGRVGRSIPARGIHWRERSSRTARRAASSGSSVGAASAT